MQVKITNQRVTFKISEDELSQLLNNQPLLQITPIGSSEFTVMIAPVQTPITEGLLLRQDAGGLRLDVSEDAIRQLADMGKSRDGLVNRTTGLRIVLQVDVRQDSRPPGECALGS